MRSRLLAPLTRQLGHPSGRLGTLVLRVLDRANAGLNAQAVAAAAFEPGEEVLDVGFGGGVGLRLLGRAGATPVGADPSADAVAVARRRLPSIEIVVAGADALPFAAGRFASVVSVNTVYFWPDVPAAMAELHRVVRPGGRVVLALEDADRLAAGRLTREFAHTDAAALGAQMGAAGFEDAAAGDGRTGARIVTGRRSG